MPRRLLQVSRNLSCSSSGSRYASVAAPSHALSVWSSAIVSPPHDQCKFGRAASTLRKRNAVSTHGRRGAPQTQVLDDLGTLLQEAKHYGKKFEPSTDYVRRLGALLHVCKSKEQYAAALPLCTIVQRSSLTHGKVAMECIRIFQKAGRNQEAVALAEKLMKQDVFLLNHALASAIQACAALRRVKTGYWLFNTAKERGSIPNLGVYSALLTVAGVAGDTKQVQTVLDQMKEAGVEINNITFHNLMSAYTRGGYTKETLALFVKMQEEGIVADDHTYAILMDAHVESGDFESAKAVMDELKQTTLQPKLVHYNVLLKGCGKVSNLTFAFQLYEEMKERAIRPDLVTFITMMHAVYHGELGTIDQKKVKMALAGLGLMGVAFVPFINYEEYMLTTLFCGSLVGSMGLAAYMNPDGVIRALYPNTDEIRNDTVIEAFFRRLREEDHCGRSMYLWREMLKFNVPADRRVYDVLVRTCVRKRFPDLAYEALFEEKLPLFDKEGVFVLSLSTTLNLLHSLLSQKRTNMADTLYDAARSHNVFDKVFSEKGDSYVYDMRSFLNEQVRCYTIIKLMDELRAKVDSSNGDFVAPNVRVLVQHGYELLDRLDADNASLRTLFSMDDMARIGASADDTTTAHYYFRLTVSSERLQTYFRTTPANAGKERQL
uniref:Pentatricopeptide repeat-containing protein-mitochondrial domain-containing protein n=1 Tax=Peronospora matthiolae TaxID=2874970 RepID=A0AAV1U0Q9_9STRA